MSKSANLSKSYTNHCIRATIATVLDRQDTVKDNYSQSADSVFPYYIIKWRENTTLSEEFKNPIDTS